MGNTCHNLNESNYDLLTKSMNTATQRQRFFLCHEIPSSNPLSKQILWIWFGSRAIFFSLSLSIGIMWKMAYPIFAFNSFMRTFFPIASFVQTIRWHFISFSSLKRKNHTHTQREKCLYWCWWNNGLLWKHCPKKKLSRSFFENTSNAAFGD